MLNAFKQLDAILRGEATQTERLRDGQIHIPIAGLLGVVVLLGAVYGACMGAYSLFRIGGAGAMQVLASAVKLPLMFFLTLLVTLPSLYVFNALVGSRLGLRSVVRLVVAMLGVTMAVLASLGPIVVFFSVSTTSYPFMKLLNVVCAAVAGILGLAFLLRTLQRLVWMREVARMNEDDGTAQAARWVVKESAGSNAAGAPPSPEASMPAAPDAPNAHLEEMDDEVDAFSPSPPPPPNPAPGQPPQQTSAGDMQAMADDDRPLHPGATPDEAHAWRERHAQRPGRKLGDGPLDRGEWTQSQRAKVVFRIWVVVFALVGAQMSWVLRPFIGDPSLPFSWFRDRESNFFIDVLMALEKLLSGG